MYFVLPNLKIWVLNSSHLAFHNLALILSSLVALLFFNLLITVCILSQFGVLTSSSIMYNVLCCFHYLLILFTLLLPIKNFFQNTPKIYQRLVLVISPFSSSSNYLLGVYLILIVMQCL